MQERLKRLQGEVDALELRNLRLMEKLCREQREDLERTRLPLAAVYHHISTEKCDLGMRPQAFALASFPDYNSTEKCDLGMRPQAFALASFPDYNSTEKCDLGMRPQAFALASFPDYNSTEKCDLGMRLQAFALASSQAFVLAPLTCTVCAFYTMNNKNYRNRLMDRGLGSESEAKGCAGLAS